MRIDLYNEKTEIITSGLHLEDVAEEVEDFIETYGDAVLRIEAKPESSEDHHWELIVELQPELADLIMRSNLEIDEFYGREYRLISKAVRQAISVESKVMWIEHKIKEGVKLSNLSKESLEKLKEILESTLERINSILK